MLNTVIQTSAFLKGYFAAKTGRFRSRRSIIKRQQRLFSKLRKNALIHSPKYSQLSSNISDYPVINKTIFLDEFDSINTVNLNLKDCVNLATKAEKSREFESTLNGYSVGLSSGTSGTRGLFVTSKKEQMEWAGYIIGKLLPLKFQKQKVALVLRSNNNLYETIDGIAAQFKYFDLLSDIGSLCESLATYDPDIIVAPASVLYYFTKEHIGLNPILVISGAEVLEPSDKTSIEKYFGCKVLEVYQCTEGFLATSCKEGNLHINEDIVIVEQDWIDKTSGRFTPIVTDLRRTTQPVIRYQLDDVLIEDPEPCDCGSKFLRLKKIEGRHDDILWWPDIERTRLIPVFSDTIRQVMMTHDNIHDYRVEQRGAAIHIKLNKLTSHTQTSVSQSFSRLFKQIGLASPTILFSSNHVPCLRQKRRRVQCKMKPSLIDFSQ